MKTIDHSTNKLMVRDLVTTGIFSALYLIFMMIGSGIFAPNPVLTFLMPCAAALVTGPIFLLLIAKVPKHGALIILGVLLGLILFVTGMYWLWAVACIVCGILADLIAGIGKFKNLKLNILSFVIFTFNPMGSYIMLWLNKDSYFGYLTDKGTEQAYVDKMGSTAQGWMLPAMFLSIIIAALISAFIGKIFLKKHFEKAGITA